MGVAERVPDLGAKPAPVGHIVTVLDRPPSHLRGGRLDRWNRTRVGQLGSPRLAVFVGVAVTVGVLEGVGESNGVSVGVAVFVGVLVTVGVLLGVGVAVGV